MPGYKLKDLGYPYKVITQRNKQVGRVYKHTDVPTVSALSTT